MVRHHWNYKIFKALTRWISVSAFCFSIVAGPYAQAKQWKDEKGGFRTQRESKSKEYRVLERNSSRIVIPVPPEAGGIHEFLELNRGKTISEYIYHLNQFEDSTTDIVLKNHITEVIHIFKDRLFFYGPFESKGKRYVLASYQGRQDCMNYVLQYQRAVTSGPAKAGQVTSKDVKSATRNPKSAIESGKDTLREMSQFQQPGGMANIGMRLVSQAMVGSVWELKKIYPSWGSPLPRGERVQPANTSWRSRVRVTDLIRKLKQGEVELVQKYSADHGKIRFVQERLKKLGNNIEKLIDELMNQGYELIEESGIVSIVRGLPCGMMKPSEDTMNLIRMKFEDLVDDMRKNSAVLKQYPKNGKERPDCFVSYAWENDTQEFVKDHLVPDLQRAGIEVIVDYLNLTIGKNVIDHEVRIGDTDYVCVVGSEKLKKKYDRYAKGEKASGIGVEMMVLHDKRFQKWKDNKHPSQTVFPILFKGRGETALTPLLKCLVYGNDGSGGELKLTEEYPYSEPSVYYYEVLRIISGMLGFKHDKVVKQFKFYEGKINANQITEHDIIRLKSWSEKKASEQDQLKQLDKAMEKHTELKRLQDWQLGLEEQKRLEEITNQCGSVLRNEVEDDLVKKYMVQFENLDPENQLWIERKEYMDQLEQYFKPRGDKKVVITTSGLGGVGKTQLALMYAHQATKAGTYPLLIWWINAETTSSLFDSFIKLGECIEIKRWEEESPDIFVGRIKDYLREHAGWLLIFDNAEDATTIKKYIPNGVGHILITSRNPNFDTIAGKNVIEVKTYSRLQSIEYIRKVKDTQEEDKILDELAEELGDLALALAQACAYISKTKISVEKYLKQYGEARQFLQKKETAPTGYPLTVQTTWLLSMQKVREDKESGKIAEGLMNLCAFLAPNDIPKDLLKFYVIKQYNLKPVEAEIAADSALGLLASLSLITLKQDSIDIHRLVQQVIRDNLKNNDEIQIIDLIIDVIYEKYQFDPENNHTWMKFLQVIEHVEKLKKYMIEEYKNRSFKTIEKLISLVNQAARYKCSVQSSIEAAKNDIDNIYPFVKKYFGSTFIHAMCYETYARLNVIKGDYKMAEKFQKKALSLFLKLSDTDPKVIMKSYTHLGSIYNNLGKYDKSNKQFQKALKFSNKLGLLNDPISAEIYNDWGYSLWKKGYSQDAIEKYKTVERLLLPLPQYKHYLAFTYDNLGLAYRDLRDKENVIRYFYKAHSIFLEVLGENHIDTATSYHNLGIAHGLQENYEEAIKNFKKSLQLRMTLLGKNNTDTAKTYYNLGKVCDAQKNYSEAQEYYKKSLEIRLAVLGENHPDTILVKNLCGINSSNNDNNNSKKDSNEDNKGADGKEEKEEKEEKKDSKDQNREGQKDQDKDDKQEDKKETESAKESEDPIKAEFLRMRFQKFLSELQIQSVVNCFITYAWEDEKDEKDDAKRVNPWIQKRLVPDLEQVKNLQLVVDYKNLRPGDSVLGHEGLVCQTDYVLVIGTPKLRKKWDDYWKKMLDTKQEIGERPGIVEELMYLRWRLFIGKYGRETTIPLMYKGNKQVSLPDFLAKESHVYPNCREDQNYYGEVIRVVSRFLGKTREEKDQWQEELSKEWKQIEKEIVSHKFTEIEIKELEGWKQEKLESNQKVMDDLKKASQDKRHVLKKPNDLVFIPANPLTAQDGPMATELLRQRLRRHLNRDEIQYFQWYVPLKAGTQIRSGGSVELEQAVMNFLDRPVEDENLLILGDSGAGKTAFCRTLEKKLLQDDCDAPITKRDFRDLYEDERQRERLLKDLMSKGYLNQEAMVQDTFKSLKSASEMQLSEEFQVAQAEIYDILQYSRYVPIYVRLRQVTNYTTHCIEETLEKLGYSSHEISELKKRYKFLLILDGYDELGEMVNLYRTNSLHQWNGKVIFTCRTQYTGRIADLRTQFLKRDETRPIGQVTELYIQPFSVEQIRDYLKKYAQAHEEPEDKYSHLFEDAYPQLKELAENPLVLNLLVLTLPKSLLLPNPTRANIYDLFFEQWFDMEFDRSSKERQKYPEKQKILLSEYMESAVDFCKWLSWETYVSHGSSIVARKPETIKSWRQEKQEQNDPLGKIFFDPSALLEREGAPIRKSAEDTYRFMHTSFHEYFLAKRLFDQLKKSENMNKDNDWNKELFVDQGGIVDFLADLISEDLVQYKNALMTMIKQTALQFGEAFEVAAANAVTVLNAARVAFINEDLSGIKITRANLENSVMDQTDLSNSILTKVRFNRAFLRNVKLDGSQIDGIEFGEMPYIDVGKGITTIALSPDGETLAVGFQSDAAIRLFEVDTGRFLTKLAGHTEGIKEVFYLDESRLLSFSWDGTVRIWNVKNGQCNVIDVGGRQHPTDNVVLLRDGKTLVIGGLPITVWDMETKRKSHEKSGEYAGIVALSPDGNTLALRTPNSEKVKFIAVEPWDLVNGLTTPKNVYTMAYSPSGKTLAVGGYAIVTIWDVQDLKSPSLLTTLRNLTGTVDSLVYLDEKSLAVAANNVSIWDIETGRLTDNLEHSGYGESCLAYSVKKKLLVASDGNGKVQFWKIKDTGFGTTAHAKETHTDSVYVLYLDDNRLASRGLDKSVNVWNINSKKLIGTLGGHKGSIKKVEYLVNEKNIITIDDGDAMKLWDAVSFRLLNTLYQGDHALYEGYPHENDRLLDMVYFPKKSLIVTRGFDGMEVRLWSAKSGELLSAIQVHNTQSREVIYPVHYSGRYNQIYVNSDKGQIELGDVSFANMRFPRTFAMGGKYWLSGLQNLEKGGWWDKDEKVTFWKVEDENFYVTLKKQSAAVYAVRFSSDGETLEIESTDGTLQLWEIKEPKAPKLQKTEPAIKNMERAFKSREYERYSPDGKMLGRQGEFTVQFLDAQTKKLLAEINLESYGWEYGMEVQYSPSWTTLAVGDNQSFRIWDISKVQEGRTPQLIWSSPGPLFLKGTSIQNVQGLSEPHRLLILQKGGVDSNENKQSSNHKDNNLQPSLIDAVTTHNNLGKLLMDQGRFNEAQDHFKSAMVLLLEAKDSKNDLELEKCYENFGTLYNLMGKDKEQRENDKESAINYYETSKYYRDKSLEIRLRCDPNNLEKKAKSAVSHHNEWVEIEVEGDGSCGFHAFAIGLMDCIYTGSLRLDEKKHESFLTLFGHNVLGQATPADIKQVQEWVQRNHINRDQKFIYDQVSSVLRMVTGTILYKGNIWHWVANQITKDLKDMVENAKDVTTGQFSLENFKQILGSSYLNEGKFGEQLINSLEDNQEAVGYEEWCEDIKGWLLSQQRLYIQEVVDAMWASQNIELPLLGEYFDLSVVIHEGSQERKIFDAQQSNSNNNNNAEIHLSFNGTHYNYLRPKKLRQGTVTDGNDPDNNDNNNNNNNNNNPEKDSKSDKKTDNGKEDKKKKEQGTGEKKQESGESKDPHQPKELEDKDGMIDAADEIIQHYLFTKLKLSVFDVQYEDDQADAAKALALLLSGLAQINENAVIEFLRKVFPPLYKRILDDPIAPTLLQGGTWGKLLSITLKIDPSGDSYFKEYLPGIQSKLDSPHRRAWASSLSESLFVIVEQLLLWDRDPLLFGRHFHHFYAAVGRDGLNDIDEEGWHYLSSGIVQCILAFLKVDPSGELAGNVLSQFLQKSPHPIFSSLERLKTIKDQLMAKADSANPLISGMLQQIEETIQKQSKIFSDFLKEHSNDDLTVQDNVPDAIEDPSTKMTDQNENKQGESKIVKELSEFGKLLIESDPGLTRFKNEWIPLFKKCLHDSTYVYDPYDQEKEYNVQNTAADSLSQLMPLLWAGKKGQELWLELYDYVMEGAENDQNSFLNDEHHESLKDLEDFFGSSNSQDLEESKPGEFPIQLGAKRRVVLQLSKLLEWFADPDSLYAERQFPEIFERFKDALDNNESVFNDYWQEYYPLRTAAAQCVESLAKAIQATKDANLRMILIDEWLKFFSEAMKEEYQFEFFSEPEDPLQSPVSDSAAEGLKILTKGLFEDDPSGKLVRSIWIKLLESPALSAIEKERVWNSMLFILSRSSYPFVPDIFKRSPQSLWDCWQKQNQRQNIENLLLIPKIMIVLLNQDFPEKLSDPTAVWVSMIHMFRKMTEVKTDDLKCLQQSTQMLVRHLSHALQRQEARLHNVFKNGYYNGQLYPGALPPKVFIALVALEIVLWSHNIPNHYVLGLINAFRESGHRIRKTALELKRQINVILLEFMRFNLSYSLLKSVERYLREEGSDWWNLHQIIFLLAQQASAFKSLNLFHKIESIVSKGVGEQQFNQLKSLISTQIAEIFSIQNFNGLQTPIELEQREIEVINYFASGAHQDNANSNVYEVESQDDVPPLKEVLGAYFEARLNGLSLGECMGKSQSKLLEIWERNKNHWELFNSSQHFDKLGLKTPAPLVHQLSQVNLKAAEIRKKQQWEDALRYVRKFVSHEIFDRAKLPETSDPDYKTVQRLQKDLEALKKDYLGVEIANEIDTALDHLKNVIDFFLKKQKPTANAQEQKVLIKVENNPIRILHLGTLGNSCLDLNVGKQKHYAPGYLLNPWVKVIYIWPLDQQENPGSEPLARISAALDITNSAIVVISTIRSNTNFDFEPAFKEFLMAWSNLLQIPVFIPQLELGGTNFSEDTYFNAVENWTVQLPPSAAGVEFYCDLISNESIKEIKASGLLYDPVHIVGSGLRGESNLLAAMTHLTDQRYGSEKTDVEIIEKALGERFPENEHEVQDQRDMPIRDVNLMSKIEMDHRMVEFTAQNQ